MHQHQMGISNLKELTYSFADPKMNFYDPAFYLATHGFYAVPKDGNVEMVLDGSIYSYT